MLRLEDQLRFGNDADAAGRDGLAQFVVSAASVDSGIFRVDAEDVECHVVEIECRTESVAGADGLAVDQPVDAHRRISDRNQPAFQVDVGAFDRLDVVQRFGETRDLLHRHLFHLLPALAGRIFQHLDLLPGAFALRLPLLALTVYIPTSSERKCMIFSATYLFPAPNLNFHF